jgi:uncharacterized membrane protein
MKPNTHISLASALALTLAGCGGGSGGGGDGGGGGGGDPPGNGNDNGVVVEPNPTFTTTAFLQEAVVGAAFGAATDLNDGSIVVGATQTIDTSPSASLRAVAWNVNSAGGSTVELLPTPSDDYSRANGVNNSGMIVGEMVDVPGGGQIVAAFWADAATEAVALQPFAASAAYGINDDGIIVGETYANGSPAAVVWFDANALPLQLSTSGAAYAISGTEAVGEMTVGTGSHAMVWRNPGGAIVDAFHLPGTATLSGDSVALAINDEGHVSGEIVAHDGVTHAVRWIKVSDTEYEVEDLGPGSAAGINLAGRSVGHDGLGGADPERGASIWRVTPPLDPFPIGAANPNDSQGLAINVNGWAAGVNVNRPFIALP